MIPLYSSQSVLALLTANRALLLMTQVLAIRTSSLATPRVVQEMRLAMSQWQSKPLMLKASSVMTGSSSQLSQFSTSRLSIYLVLTKLSSKIWALTPRLRSSMAASESICSAMVMLIHSSPFTTLLYASLVVLVLILMFLSGDLTFQTIWRRRTFFSSLKWWDTTSQWEIPKITLISMMRA